MKGYTHSFDKFNLATSSLTEVETMMYLRLLWELYETEEPIKTPSKYNFNVLEANVITAWYQVSIAGIVVVISA